MFTKLPVLQWLKNGASVCEQWQFDAPWSGGQARQCRERQPSVAAPNIWMTLYYNFSKAQRGTCFTNETFISEIAQVQYTLKTGYTKMFRFLLLLQNLYFWHNVIVTIHEYTECLKLMYTYLESYFSTTKWDRNTIFVVCDPKGTETEATRSLFFMCLNHGCANHDTEGKRFKSPIHCCDVTRPPYLFSGELCTCTSHYKLLFVHTVCYRSTRQCFSVLRARKSDVILT